MPAGNSRTRAVPCRRRNRWTRLPVAAPACAAQSSGNAVPAGFYGYIVFEGDYDEVAHGNLPALVVSSDLAYLVDGDVIRVSNRKKRIRVLFRCNARQNGLLLTERCNHYCLMCSQPPKDHDDSYLIDEIKEVLRLASSTSRSAEIGFTGGEPTLLGDDFISLVRTARNYMPESSLHVLSNGRAFEDEEFARKLGEVVHHDLMIGGGTMINHGVDQGLESFKCLPGAVLADEKIKGSQL